MIDPIFNLFKVKFDKLDELNLLKPEKERAIVYINVEMVFKYLYTKRVNEFATSMESKQQVQMCLISNIINLAQHYRLYFTKYKMENEIILYWNYPAGTYKNQKYIDTYRAYYDNRMYKNTDCFYIKERMDMIITFLGTLSDYVNQVYVVTDDRVESSMIPYILWKEKYDSDHYHNIIISDDKYDYQYVDYGFDVVIPDKENSVILNKDNVIPVLMDDMKVKRDMNISYKFLPFILSLLGNKYRSIPKINGVGLSSIMKYLRNALDQYLITENTTNIEMLCGILKDDIKDTFMKNYHCTNFDYQYHDLEPLDIHTLTKQIVDKYDDNALLYMNDRYFKEFPLMLINPMREQILNRNYKGKSIFDR